MRKVLSCMLILILSLVGCGKAAEPTTTTTTTTTTSSASTVKVPGVTADTITVGGILDMTGPVADTCGMYKQGIDDYFHMINDKGGINGRKIVVKWEDDHWETAKALIAFRKLTTEGNGIFALAGQVGSTQWVGLDPEVRDQKIPVVGPGQATKMQADNPYTFNTMMAYLDQGSLMVQRAVETFKGPGKPKIAIVAPEGASSLEFGDAIKKKAAQLGATVVDTEIIPYSATEMSGPITKIKQSGADVTLILANTTMMISYLRDGLRLGLDIPVISAYATLLPVIWETAGKDAAKNYTGLHPYSPIYGDGTGLEEMRLATAKYNTSPQTTSSLTYVQGWSAATVFVEGLKRAGKDLTRDGFVKAIGSIQNFETGGVSGPISYSATDHNGTKWARFYTYDYTKKLLVPISAFVENK